MSGCRCEDPTCHGCAPDPTPFADLRPYDGGNCPRHGAFPDPGCVGCPPNWVWRFGEGMVVRYDKDAA